MFLRILELHIAHHIRKSNLARIKNTYVAPNSPMLLSLTTLVQYYFRQKQLPITNLRENFKNQVLYCEKNYICNYIAINDS